MEKLQKQEHEFPSHPLERIELNDRFKRIKEMILLPEDDVSFTTAPREAEDHGLPLLLFFLFGLAFLVSVVMLLIFWGVGNNWVNLSVFR